MSGAGDAGVARVQRRRVLSFPISISVMHWPFISLIMAGAAVEMGM